MLRTVCLLSPHQNRFVPRRSCCTQLLHAFNDWTLSLDEHLSTDVVYFDFSKAFDSVPHTRLLLKLEQLKLQVCSIWNLLWNRAHLSFLHKSNMHWMIIFVVNLDLNTLIKQSDNVNYSNIKVIVNASFRIPSCWSIKLCSTY